MTTSSVFWKYPTGADVKLVCLSADGNYIAATVNRVSKTDVLLLGSGGNLMWNKSYSPRFPDKISISISSDASYVAVLEKENHEVSLFNRDGQMLWEKSLLNSSFIADMEISSSGRYIVACDGHNVVLFNMTGEQIWKYELNASVYQVSISSSGEHIAAACGNNEIYFLNDKKQLLWSYTLNMSYFSSDEEKIICVSPNGDYLVAATHGQTPLLCLDDDGKVSWSESRGCDSVSVSEDRIALADFNLVFLYRNGTEYSQYSAHIENGFVRFEDVAISADGKYACAAGSDGCIYFLEVLKSVNLSMNLDKGDWQVIPGETLSVKVSLLPPIAEASITLTYMRPNGTTISKVVKTAADGSYIDTFMLDTAGNWTMKASWPGDAVHWGDETMRELKVGGYPIRIGEEVNIKVYGGVSFLYNYHVLECPKFIHYSCSAYIVIGGSNYVSHWIKVDPSGKTGVYWIKVDGDGIPDFYRRIEVLPPETKYDTQVTISLPKNETGSGSQITVDGIASFMVEGNWTTYSGLEVNLVYGKPNGETFTRTVTTDRTGKFHDSPRLYEEGVWNITAIIPDDNARNKSQSETLRFAVKPSFFIYFIVGAIAVAGAIIFLVAFRIIRKSRKRHAEKPVIPPSITSSKT